MTIAISLKVNDGIVLAADSASTILAKDPATGTIGALNVYNHANKVFNLCKGLPIGAVTWGAGSIGVASMSTIIKDLRDKLSSASDWKLRPDNCTVQEAAEKLKRYVFDELYSPWANSSSEKPALGFIVAGYSTNGGVGEEYKIEANEGIVAGPTLLRRQEQVGATWGGEGEAINRLVLGYGTELPNVLKGPLGMPADQVPVAMAVIQQGIAGQTPLIIPAMPIQDAIDLAEFLVELTVKFARFRPGAPTVGGPIEVAAITKHEKFKWIKRKHYYHRDLNPPDHQQEGV